jgi:hypothetical protein
MLWGLIQIWTLFFRSCIALLPQARLFVDLICKLLLGQRKELEKMLVSSEEDSSSSCGWESRTSGADSACALVSST